MQEELMYGINTARRSSSSTSMGSCFKGRKGHKQKDPIGHDGPQSQNAGSLYTVVFGVLTLSLGIKIHARPHMLRALGLKTIAILYSEAYRV